MLLYLVYVLLLMLIKLITLNVIKEQNIYLMSRSLIKKSCSVHVYSALVINQMNILQMNVKYV